MSAGAQKHTTQIAMAYQQSPRATFCGKYCAPDNARCVHGIKMNTRRQRRENARRRAQPPGSVSTELVLAIQSSKLGDPSAPLDLVIGASSGILVDIIDGRTGDNPRRRWPASFPEGEAGLGRRAPL